MPHTWRPFLHERSWAADRENYSADSRTWDYRPYHDARSRVYRWGADGIAGISDHYQHSCFALRLWNEKNQVLKERMGGLPALGPELIKRRL